jgi:hypothetical protein
MSDLIQEHQVQEQIQHEIPVALTALALAAIRARCHVVISRRARSEYSSILPVAFGVTGTGTAANPRETAWL